MRNAGWGILVGSLALGACSSNGGGGGDPGASRAAASAGRCAAPRTGVDPWTGEPLADVKGTVADEKRWVRAWIDELYLWYREVPDPNPATFATVGAYFDVLKTPALTPSGKAKDRFHFTYPTTLWAALSLSGVEPGYGVDWVVLEPAPPRRVIAAWVEPGSPAASAGVVRGAELMAVDGVDVGWGSDIDTLNAGTFPQARGETHALVVRDARGSRTVVLTSGEVEHAPVPIASTVSTPTGTVGYLLFNDHVATAEIRLATAIAQLRDAGATDLVLDLRYNGGGYLQIAAELAYMIAGPARTAGKAFERLVFNDKVTSTNPVTGGTLAPVPFVDRAEGFSLERGTPLPTLGLDRVFVLTGAGTCSASESVMNGLRGAGVEVLQVGATTCGKPYGFYPQDNCGTTYFAIHFQTANELGFGGYGDGFVPGGAGAAGVPGCVVADDYAHALGDPAEARFAAALTLRSTGRCPATVALAPGAEGPDAREAKVVKAPWREIRVMRR